MRPVSFNDARRANRAMPPAAECPTPARRVRLAPTIIRSNDPARPVANSFRVEPMGGTVTRGRHVPCQPRARIGKSYRLVPDPAVFCWARPSFVSLVSSTTNSRQRPHDPRLLR
jgi:hypothetical protein